MQRIGRPGALHGELGRLYDAIENPRRSRGELPILRGSELRAYLEDVRQRTLDVLEEVQVGPEVEDPLLCNGFVYEMLLAHEYQHNETMLQLLMMVDGYEPACAEPGPIAEPRPAGPEMALVEARQPRFRRRRWSVRLRQRAPAPRGRAGRLRNRSHAGHQRRSISASSRRPWPSRRCYWERDGRGGWLRAAMGRREPVDPGPSGHPRLLARGRRLRPLGRQASADRAGVGGRLRGRRPGAREPRPARLRHRRPPAPIRMRRPSCGAVQMLGDVWEWTASDFVALSRLRGLPLSRVLRGLLRRRLTRCCAAAPGRRRRGAIRPSFRNWDLPERRQIFAGIRCARDAELMEPRTTAEQIEIEVHLASGGGARWPTTCGAASPRRRRSCRRSTSTTSADRSCSSGSPSCPSTTRPAPSARSSPTARRRSSPRPESPERSSSSARARPPRRGTCSTR